MPPLPANASWRPDGENAGWESSEVTAGSRVKPVPVEEISASCLPASKASWRPSGRQTGVRYSIAQSPSTVLPAACWHSRRKRSARPSGCTVATAR